MTSQEYMFWIVWAEGGGAPTVKHENEGAAKAEAKRLAMNNPGTRFIVAQATHGYRLVAMQETTFDDIPF